MTTRSQNHITKPKTHTDGTVRYPVSKALLAVTESSTVDAEPTCFTSAVKSPAWRAAMNLEFDALLKNHTWQLVPPHSSQNLIGCKWVFRTKRKADGSVERHKARLVAKGFHQQPGVDFDETYSPVIKPTTVSGLAKSVRRLVEMEEPIGRALSRTEVRTHSLILFICLQMGLF